MSQDEMVLGMVGLGSMGGRMARRLLDAGWKMVICDRVPEVKEEFDRLGAEVVETAAEVAAVTDLVLLSLPRPDDVRSVVLGAGGLIEGGRARTIIDLSTTGPDAAAEIAAAAAERGKTMIDAPVSGGPPGAEKGTLCIMVAGDEDACAEAWPVLEVLGGEIVRLGPDPGQGQAMKVINNMISATAMSATCEGLVLGRKMGLSPDEMVRVLNASTARNTHTEDKIPRCVLTGEFDFGFQLELMLKDIGLCLGMAQERGVPMWISNATRQLFTIAVNDGESPHDITEIIRPLEEWAEVEVRSAASLPGVH